jgi:hypothetical protein
MQSEGQWIKQRRPSPNADILHPDFPAFPEVLRTDRTYCTTVCVHATQGEVRCISTYYLVGRDKADTLLDNRGTPSNPNLCYRNIRRHAVLHSMTSRLT